MTAVSVMMNLFVLLTGVLFAVMPEMSRPGTLFGVTVSPDFLHTPEGRAALRRYRRNVTLVTVLLLAVSNVGSGPSFLVPLRVFVAGLGGIACWLGASKQIRAFAQPASSIRVASLTPPTRTLPGGWLFLFGPYAMLFLAGVFLYVNRSSIPERFPIHWDINGEANGWSRRNFFGVFALPLIGFVVNTITIGMASVLFLKTRTPSGDVRRSTDDAAFKRASFFVIVFVAYLISTLFAIISTRPVWASDPDSNPTEMIPLLILTVAASLGAVVYLVHVSRSRVPSADGTPDECWKWGGMIYYNPNDASLFVEKRMGVGWTLNFANKWSWAFIALPLIVPAITVVSLALSK